MTNTITKITLDGNDYKVGEGNEVIYVTQAEYESLLPGAASDDKHYIIYESSTPPTPPSPGRQPGVNTVVYYPFDSTNTVNDLSGNNHTLTNRGNITFGIVDGVDCANFPSDGKGLAITSGSIFPTGDYTYLGWINLNTTLSGNACPRIFGGVNEYFVLDMAEQNHIYTVSFFSDVSKGVPYTAGWHLVCFTGTKNTGVFNSYKDGVYLDSGTSGLTSALTGLIIGQHETNPNSSVDRFVGQMSRVILENRIWTATEISNYYDQTKGYYGIS